MKIEMTDIEPRYVDGEPLCSGSICKLYHDACDNTNVGACKGNDGRSICVAGLRKQRDELKEQVTQAKKCNCDKCQGFPKLACGHYVDDHCDCKWAKG